jgi:adenosine deaminase
MLSTRETIHQGCRVFNKQNYLYDEDLEKFLNLLPKIELHVHLDGSFEPSILYQHWEKKNEISEADFIKKVTCGGKYSLSECLKCFDILVPIVQGNLELLELLAHEFVKRQADQNIMYTEVRYSPHFFVHDENDNMEASRCHMEARLAVDAITKGLRRGCEEFNVVVNQILCCLNWRSNWSDDVVSIAAERREDYPCAVVGIDLAAGEDFFEDPNVADSLHFKAFKRAKELGIKITMHAGEAESGENVFRAINLYLANRIGHGYRLVNSKSFNAEVIQYLKNKNIHFECCPTSSVETGGWKFTLNEENKINWEQHPTVILLRNGISVGLNSDDPAVFDTSLTSQLRIGALKMKLNKAELVKTIQNSIEASFAPDDTKVMLKKMLAHCEKHS